MGERVDGVIERLTSVETKVDSLAATMDRRFDEVAAGLGEQRRYTDFAYERLNGKISRLDDRVSRLDDKVSRLDDKVSRLDDRMSTIEKEMHSGFAQMDQIFLRLDQKLDQLIDRA